MSLDPIALSQALIRCPSVTPEDAGVLAVLEAALEPVGFTCHRLRFEEPGALPVENLYARFGTSGKNFCFAGHTDVVPVGDAAAWKHPPFAAEIHDGFLYGRGAEDMKSAVAAFAVAAARFIGERKGVFGGSISLLITGDEEGPAVNGTRKVLGWLKERGETLDACIVGEPTNPSELGEMAKIGRRGSITFHLTVQGRQGHVAYPHLAENPVTPLVRILTKLKAEPLDTGTKFFPPSNLEVVTVDVGNKADNVIPAQASAKINVRFNTEHSAAVLEKWVRSICDAEPCTYALRAHASAEPFITPPGPLSGLVVAAVEKVTGRVPELSTTGGTSDARFIKDFCPVVEFGTTGRTSHQVDENVRVEDIRKLAEIYFGVLTAFFAE